MSLDESVDRAVQEMRRRVGAAVPVDVVLWVAQAKVRPQVHHLDTALDEINTLIEVQCTLQDATAGYLFNSWNGKLSAPEKS